MIHVPFPFRITFLSSFFSSLLEIFFVHHFPFFFVLSGTLFLPITFPFFSRFLDCFFRALLFFPRSWELVRMLRFCVLAVLGVCLSESNWPHCSVPLSLSLSLSLSQLVSQVLDEDHYGLKELKDRILEFIAVGNLTGGVSGKVRLWAVVGSGIGRERSACCGCVSQEVDGNLSRVVVVVAWRWTGTFQEECAGGREEGGGGIFSKRADLGSQQSVSEWPLCTFACL
jgi:hypothetical protein